VPKPVVDMSEDGLGVMVYTLVPFLGLAVVIAAVYWFYRHRKLAYFNEVLCTSFVVLYIHVVFLKKFGEWYQKTNKTRRYKQINLIGARSGEYGGWTSFCPPPPRKSIN
jgi:hypothetical protein